MPADLDLIHRLFGRSLRHRIYRYESAALFLFSILDTSINECEQRVILAQSDILTGMPFGASLAHNNVASGDVFAAKNFDAKALAC
jgi:hypothetical protein